MLTKEQTNPLARRMAERKAVLLEEVRRGLARSGSERYAEQIGEAGDEGDASLRDIVAAEGRMAAGRYGICVDCGAAIGYPRLSAYPTAKRCLRCQQEREKSGRYGPQPTL